MAHGDLEISGDGEKGVDGRDGYGYTGHAAQFGVNGMNGEHAGTGTEGKPGQTVHVSLSRSPDAFAGHPPGYIVVTIDKHAHQCIVPKPHTKEIEECVHDLGHDGAILLSACGGDGGLGGSGGHGQGGGHGRHGTDANRQMSGTNGEGGGNGGNGGDGTSGAPGGRAGEIKLVIKDEDTDLLVAMRPPLVLGGRGGTAGKNGNPGKGGTGGDGGAPYTWQETTRTDKVTTTITRTNAGGLGGSGGQAGASGRAKIENGKDGANGTVSIFIQNQDGQLTGPFASAYQLEVLDFDIVDANEDGVLEFGEEITLRKIRIKNSGGAPSPKFAQVTLQGLSTAWLVAPQTTLTLPISIMNGSTITLPGTIVFRVKRANTFPVGRVFQVDDAFKLQGYMSKIGRNIPGFHLPKKITIQHPIKMTSPRYLRCLTVGQQAVFSWTVENISAKDLGSGSGSRRQIKMIAQESGDPILDFGSANSKVQTERFDYPISTLASRRSTRVEMTVKVVGTATPYTKTNARVSLHFTPPDNSAPCSIQDYELPIQVSNTFRHNPDATVLLVTNFGTSADEIENWQSLVCDRLGLKMDIWNVSLNGHLEQIGGPNSAGRKSLFDLYKGKTIVMLGNSFQYFNRGPRTAMDLIDEKDFAPATLSGTSLFVSGIDLDEASLIHVPRLLRASSYPLTRDFRTVKELVKAVLTARNDNGFFDTKFICLPTRRGNDATRCAAKAKRAADELRRRVPNLRFVIAWTSAAVCGDRAKGAAGEVEVMPCTPYDNAKFVLTRNGSTRRFEEINGFSVLLALPFSTRLRMLWDELADDTVEKTGNAPKGLVDIVEFDMVIELARFTNANPPWPDCIAKHEILSHLKRLEGFFSYNTNRPFSRASVNRVTTILGNLMLLADCCSGTWPRALTFSTRRKNLWSELTQHIDMFLSRHYGHLEGNPAIAQYNNYVLDQTVQMRSENVDSRKERVVQRSMAKVALGVGINISDTTDVVDVEMMGNVVKSEKELQEWKSTDASQEKQLEDDLAHAKQEVDDMSRLPMYA